MSTELQRQIFLNIKRLGGIAADNSAELFNECSATWVQFGVLRNIAQDGSTMTHLKQSVSCAASNMTTLVKRMERDGLVRTERNPADLRETKVFITAYGQAVFRSMEPLYRQFLSGLCRGLDEEEQLQLNTLLQRLIRNFE